MGACGCVWVRVGRVWVGAAARCGGAVALRTRVVSFEQRTTKAGRFFGHLPTPPAVRQWERKLYRFHSIAIYTPARPCTASTEGLFPLLENEIRRRILARMEAVLDHLSQFAEQKLDGLRALAEQHQGWLHEAVSGIHKLIDERNSKREAGPVQSVKVRRSI